MAKSKKKVEKWVEPEWDPWYCKMLDAVGEYMDSISGRKDDDITERDVTIIRALIEFYGFETDDMKDILDDIHTRSEQLEREKKKNENH